MSFKILNVQHRHCVFTIDDALWPLFLEDRTLLSCLFSAVNSVVTRMFQKHNKSEAFTPGFICVLHTFGRDLKWHPHIHCLISEGGIGNSGRWRSVTHFNYKLLRDSFQTALLNELHARLGDSFKKTKAACYRNHKNGFYVYAKPNKCAPNVVAKYIGRYLGRPVIATSRIDNYDGESVTFHYNRHEDNAYVQETSPVLEFIERLIQHIPEKHSILLSFNRWRECTLLSFGYDPLQCPCCGQKMLFLELYHNHQHVSLDELYEKAMQKSHHVPA